MFRTVPRSQPPHEESRVPRLPESRSRRPALERRAAADRTRVYGAYGLRRTALFRLSTRGHRTSAYPYRVAARGARRPQAGARLRGAAVAGDPRCSGTTLRSAPCRRGRREADVRHVVETRLYEKRPQTTTRIARALYTAPLPLHLLRGAADAARIFQRLHRRVPGYGTRTRVCRYPLRCAR